VPTLLIATAGAEDANSFVTAAEYVAYVATRLHLPEGVTVAGETLTGDEERALLDAARDLDALPWPGVAVDAVQRLSWPRYSDSGMFWSGHYAATDPVLYLGGAAIPRRLKEAQIERALDYLRAGATDPMLPAADAGLIRKKTDVLEREWDPSTRRPQGWLAQSPRVAALIAPLFGSGNAVVRT
jgi:hypothetical protein